MSSTSETQGFFSSTGALRQDSVSQSSAGQSSQPSASDTPSVTEQAAKITDDAVYTETSKLNTAGTGYDTGVSQLVNQAVTSALNKIGSKSTSNASSGATVPAFKGGTYQNEILSGAGTTPAPSQPPNDGGSAPVTSPPTDTVGPPVTGNGRGRGNGGTRGQGGVQGRGRRSLNAQA